MNTRPPALGRLKAWLLVGAFLLAPIAVLLYALFAPDVDVASLQTAGSAANASLGGASIRDFTSAILWDFALIVGVETTGSQAEKR
jgi:hypothetical protein